MEGGIEIANLSHVSCPNLVLVACLWTWGFSMAFRFFKREKQNVKGSPRVEAIVQLRILTSYTPSYLTGSKCFPLSSQHLDPIWILETRLPCTQITYNSSYLYLILAQNKWPEGNSFYPWTVHIYMSFLLFIYKDPNGFLISIYTFSRGQQSSFSNIGNTNTVATLNWLWSGFMKTFCSFITMIQWCKRLWVSNLLTLLLFYNILLIL